MLDPRDLLYAGALAGVCVVVPLVLVSTATQTAVAVGTGRAADVERQNLREERAAVRDAVAALADDYRQRGATPTEAEQLAGVVLGASVKIESTARGVSGGLRFLSLTIGLLGLIVGLLRWLAPSPALRTVTK